MSPRARPVRAALGVALAVGVTAPARAESLADALVLAFETNPTLQSQRAQLRALDAEYAAARAAFGPTVQIQTTASYAKTFLGKDARANERITTPKLPDYVEQNSGQANLTVDQTLFSGGRMSADVSASAAKLHAGREALRATEGNVMLAVIQAYADVRRDQQALVVRQTNLDALEQQLSETRARLKAGEVTRTDEAQAEAQLALERSLYAQAQAQLMTSRANYAALVGRDPEDLKPEPDFADIPKTVDQAFDAAEVENPDLRQARFSEAESRAKVSSARATYSGQVTAHAQVGYSGSLTPYDPRNLDCAISGQIIYTRPLFTGGLASAQIEQALQLNSSDRFNIEAARRGVVQNVTNAWNQIITTARSIEAETEQVRAAGVAFTGMRIEYRAGERSTLDVLIAEETLRDAELALLSARHDAVVAKAALLRHMGRLRLEALVEAAPAYEPAAHFRTLIHAVEAPWSPLVRRIDKAAKPKARPPTRPARARIMPTAKIAEALAPTDLAARPLAEASTAQATTEARRRQ